MACVCVNLSLLSVAWEVLSLTGPPASTLLYCARHSVHTRTTVCARLLTPSSRLETQPHRLEKGSHRSRLRHHAFETRCRASLSRAEPSCRLPTPPPSARALMRCWTTASRASTPAAPQELLHGTPSAAFVALPLERAHAALQAPHASTTRVITISMSPSPCRAKFLTTDCSVSGCAATRGRGAARA